MSVAYFLAQQYTYLAIIVFVELQVRTKHRIFIHNFELKEVYSSF